MKSGMLIASIFLLACAGASALAKAIPIVRPASRTTSIESLPTALRSVQLASGAKDAAAPQWIAGSVIYDEQKVLPSVDASQKVFGWSVALSPDGTTAMIGAPNNSGQPGAVYVFSNAGGVWTETQELKPVDSRAADFFGSSIAISGNAALIGASYGVNDASTRTGAAYIFTQSGGAWTQVQKLTAEDGVAFDNFGMSVALDGETAIIGNNTCSSGSPGAAYVFTASTNVWAQTQKLIASDSAQWDCFGQSVAISGSSAIIGANDRAYAFEESNDTWTETQILAPSDGAISILFATSIALQGTTAVVGASYGGVYPALPGWAYVFNQSGGIWTESQKLVPSNADQCVAGATTSRCAFGYSVALDGASIIIGADLANNATDYHGAAYVYSESNGIWTEEAILAASDGARADQFGSGVAIHGATVLVGASYAPGDVNNSHWAEGAAYFYAPASPHTGIHPGSLSFSLPSGGNGTSTFEIGNSGNAELIWAIGEAAARSPEKRLDLVPTLVSGKRLSDSKLTFASSDTIGPRHAPWTPRTADGEISFVLDDGSYETSIGWGPNSQTEYPAIWLNSFTPPSGTGPFTVNSISITWPQTPVGTLVGREVNLLAYYDADEDGDPANAVRLGGDNYVTIASLDSFIDYTVNFNVPGDGDIYVGFESTYALGGSTPLLFPGAIDRSDLLQTRSWLAGMESADPDPNDLGNNEYLGTNVDMAAFGTWMIRATGAIVLEGQECSSPSDVAWLSESPNSGSVAAGQLQNVIVTVNAAGLSPGNYSAVLCVTTNDPMNALIQIPVSLTVDVGDGVFEDGFDGNSDPQ